MKKKIVLVLCAAVMIAAFCLSAVMVSNANQVIREYDTLSALSNNDDKLAVALSTVYKRAGDVVLSLPHAGATLTQTAVMKHFAGDGGALSYLNTNADVHLNNAYSAMEDILVDFDNILTSYNVPSGSSYRTKRSELSALFSGLKSANTELIRRARTFISYSGSGYDSYYTAYCEQLQVVTDKFESASKKISTEYDSLISGLMGEDYHLVQ